MRWIDYGRLSHLTDVSTSPERQTEVNQRAIDHRGERIVAHLMDTDVSGAISPFKREELGPYLTDPDLINTWDGIVVPKLDRIGRSLLDFCLFLEWCAEHGKAIISVAEGFDLTTPWGQACAKILMIFAEFERNRMRERRAEAAVKLRELGRWGGGPAPYGYTLKQIAGGSYLYQDIDEAIVVWRIVDWIIDGWYLTQVADKLNDEGTPAPGADFKRKRYAGRKSEWSAKTLWRFLHNRLLLGELTFHGNPVLNDAGGPIYVTDEPLLDGPTWSRLQAALRANSRAHGKHSASHLMLRVAYCGADDHPYYYLPGSKAGVEYNYYRCAVNALPKHKRIPHHDTANIPAAALEGAAEHFLLDGYGDAEIERRAGAGRDYAAELTMAQTELDELEQEYLNHNLSAPMFARMSTALEQRIGELGRLAETDPGPRWEPAGETVRQRWERLKDDPAGRHRMLLDLGLVVYVHRVWDVQTRKPGWRVETDWLDVAEAHERITRA